MGVWAQVVQHLPSKALSSNPSTKNQKTDFLAMSRNVRSTMHARGGSFCDPLQCQDAAGRVVTLVRENVAQPRQGCAPRNAACQNGSTGACTCASWHTGWGDFYPAGPGSNRELRNQLEPWAARKKE
jgi:hypothetical protein